MAQDDEKPEHEDAATPGEGADKDDVLPQELLSQASLQLDQLKSGQKPEPPKTPDMGYAVQEAPQRKEASGPAGQPDIPGFLTQTRQEQPAEKLAEKPAEKPTEQPEPEERPREERPEPTVPPVTTPAPTLEAEAHATQAPAAENWMDREYGHGHMPEAHPVHQRYSGMVRALRIILPLTALVILAVVLIWLNLGGVEEPAPPPPDVAQAPPGQTEMTGANYQGVDEKDQPYTLTSDRTVQSTENPDVVELEYPMADITLEDGTWLAIRANYGAFNQETGILSLSDNVELFHDQGYHLKTEELDVNLTEGTASSDVRVWGQGPTGRLDATGMRITDSGKLIRFFGRAHMTILDAARPETPGPSQTNEDQTDDAP